VVVTVSTNTDRYGRRLVVFIATLTALVQSDTTQVYFNSFCYLHMCAACFGEYFGYPQACQYKDLTVVMLYDVKT